MSVERVSKALSRFGKQNQIREFPVSSATVAQAAQALETEEARIAKSLTFAVPEGCVMVVCAGDARVDNARFKRQFGRKANMLAPADVERLTGYRIGGVCPFALEDYPVTVYLDESLRRFETVFPACGSSNSAIALTCGELEAFSGAAAWVDVCKGWREEAEHAEQ